MLNHIFVRDLAIVSSLELDFDAGMSSLTGETGAGKSILIDALGLALGDRSDPEMIRGGCDRAEVIVRFDLAACPGAREWLAAQDLDDGDECIVRRVLARKGRARAYINARPATGVQLRALGQRLVDIHGQHAHQSLLRAAAQRELLDGYGGHASLAAEVAALYRRFRDRDGRLCRLEAQSAERAARLDLLRYQVDELDALGLSVEEIRELDQEQRRLAHLEQLHATTGSLLQELYDGEPSLHQGLSHAASELDVLIGFDERLGDTRDLVESAAIQIEEAAGNLRQYLDGLDPDPGLRDQVETQLAQLHDLARKYRVLPEQIPEAGDRLRRELHTLESDDTALQTLAREREEAHAAFLAAAGTLSDMRGAAARRLGETVSAAMQELGMCGGRFAVQVTRGAQDAGGVHGLDQIEFRVSANPGQPLQPLAKVASGGELSRISLGIQVATAECGTIPTLVFDEVDVGIGGAVAEIVGRLLRTLGASRQVLCVTHLPQVAAQGHNHLKVSKYSRDGETFAAVETLGDAERVGEIARMLGGTEMTEKTREHAREMIGRSQG
jgi:DNA repair protein RecN (Recombination protein N)